MGKKRINKKRYNNNDREAEVIQTEVVTDNDNSGTPSDAIMYRILEPYTCIPVTILMNHVNGQSLWIPQIIKLLADNNVPSDIVDTTMFSDSDTYDEHKYATWAARMITRSDIVILNLDDADGEASIGSLIENLETGLFDNKYILIRLNSNLNGETIEKIMTLIDPMSNVLATTDDKHLVQSVYAVAKSFNQ